MSSADRRNGVARIAMPMLIATATLLGAAASVLSAPSDPDAAVAAVFPPWWQREQAAAAVARADGLIIREGINGTVVVVRPNGPHLAERLREHGALLIADPIAASGCLTLLPPPNVPRGPA